MSPVDFLDELPEGVFVEVNVKCVDVAHDISVSLLLVLEEDCVEVKVIVNALHSPHTFTVPLCVILLQQQLHIRAIKSWVSHRR